MVSRSVQSTTVGGESTGASRTLAGDVTHRLRSDLISGVLAPGTRLRFERLRSIYGASFSTIREALSALSSEGFVEVEGQRGFSVSAISASDLEDLTDSRVLVEREVMRLSILRGNDAWEASLLAAYHRLDRMIGRGGGDYHSNSEWNELHAAFHAAFASACGSPTLLAIRKNLFDRAHRYRCIASLAPSPARDKHQEHRALLELALKRDSEAAQAMVEQHIRGTAKNVLLALQGLPTVPS